MRELLRADIGEDADDLVIGHGIALVQIAHGSADFAVRSAELADDDFGSAGIGIFDLDGKFELFIIGPHQLASLSQGHGPCTHFHASQSVCDAMVSGPYAASYSAAYFI